MDAATLRASKVMYQNNAYLGKRLCFYISAVKMTLSNLVFGQRYRLEIDGSVFEGDYMSILISNGPGYAKGMNPAVDAHPNDGLLDIYVARKASRIKVLRMIRKYMAGEYGKYPETITHYRGTRVVVSSDEVMRLTVDDKPFFENSAEYEILPGAVDFVCPGGIDMKKIPRVYGKVDR
jgi:diacylglycerol kinase family enzyme